MSIDNSSGASTWALEYQGMIYSYKLVDDAIMGEPVIKLNDSWYLPFPSAFEDLTKAPIQSDQSRTHRIQLGQQQYRRMWQQNQPFWDSNPAKRAYKQRAAFPDWSAATLRGLMGIATTEEPKIVLPKDMEYLLETATKDGMDIVELFFFLVSEILKHGRVVTLADIDLSDKEIRVCVYDALSFINWKEGLLDTKVNTTLAVFEEWRDKPEASKFSSPEVITHIVVEIDNTKQYAVSTYVEDVLIEGSYKNPDYKGKTLDFIPMVCTGSVNFKLTPNPSPLHSIASLALQDYQKSADLNMAEFLSCNPMLTISGIDADTAPITAGSTVALILPDPEAKAYYPATDTSAMAHVLMHKSAIFEEAKALGGNLLGSEKKTAEAAEALRIRQSASGANLKAVVLQAGKGLQKILRIIGRWKGKTDKELEEIIVIPNTDFADVVITAEEQKALLDSWMGGGISHPEYRWNLRRAGLLPGEDEAVAEKELIDEELTAITAGVLENASNPPATTPPVPAAKATPPPKDESDASD